MDPGELVSDMVSTAAALVTFMIVIVVVRKMSGDLPVEPYGLVERLIARPASEGRRANPAVHVEFRDSEGALIDLGPLVSGELRNGRGKRFALHEGVFVDCDAREIGAGTVVNLAIQHGLVRETTVVKLDHGNQVLFVDSAHSQATLLEKINRCHAKT